MGLDVIQLSSIQLLNTYHFNHQIRCVALQACKLYLPSQAVAHLPP